MTTKKHDTNLVEEGSPNLDPITGEPGAHPVGVGLGAAGAGAAGAAMGAVAGPVGAAVGAAVGAVVGGLAGKSVAESVDPTIEEAYWADNYQSRPYYEKDYSYDDYAPAYKQGWEARTQYADADFETVEPHLVGAWESHKPKSKLSWEKARHAARDAWERIGNR